MTERPYLDFYAKQGVQLVSRNIEDSDRFFKARESLYVSLGLSPGLLKQKTVIEFGPGTGHNALYTDCLRPSRFVLVDGSSDILAASKEGLMERGNHSVEREYICSLFDDYQSDEVFDLVIAEGCIPNQRNPIHLFKKMQRFVKPGGSMLFTTVSAASWLSEIIRRLAKNKAVPVSMPVSEQVEILVPLFAKHFDILRNMARTPQDWILDNLVQPLGGGKLFTIPDAIGGLSNEFIVSGTAPAFTLDWSWYKDVPNLNREKNDKFIESYFRNVLNFCDQRFVRPEHSQEVGRRVESIATNIWDQICRLEDGEHSMWEKVFSSLSDLMVVMAREAPETASSLKEAMEWIEGGLGGRSLKYFPSWWGRGQQHMCIFRTIP